MPNTAQPPAEIAATIRLVRGQRVLLDVDLAQVYGVTTKRPMSRFGATAIDSPRISLSSLQIRILQL